MSTRKPKETPKETPEQKEQREKAEKAAEELVQQEEPEKARSKQPKTQSLRRQLQKTRRRLVKPQLNSAKTKEQAAEGEQTMAQKRRIKAAYPANDDPGDRPPPKGDDQPWQIYQYRPHTDVTAILVFEGEDSRGQDITTSNQPTIWMCEEPGGIIHPWSGLGSARISKVPTEWKLKSSGNPS